MNRNDQKSIGNLYTEAILQRASIEMTPEQEEAIDEIKDNIDDTTGMPIDDLYDLVDIIFPGSLSGLNNRTYWPTMKKLVSKVLNIPATEIFYNGGVDGTGYVYADVK
jgi:hypothetical protein